MLEVSENDISEDKQISTETIIKEIGNDLEEKRKKQMEEMMSKLKLNSFSVLNDGEDEDDDEE